MLLQYFIQKEMGDNHMINTQSEKSERESSVNEEFSLKGSANGKQNGSSLIEVE
jgi:hypothetical protein